MQSPVALTAAIETGFNQYLAMDPATTEAMDSLNDKVIELRLTGIDMPLYILPGKHTTVLAAYDGQADACISGTPLALMRMSASSRAENSLFSGDVTMSGDTATAQHFKAVLDNANIDWEEHLSRLTGDVIAHQLKHKADNITAWGLQALSSLGLDSADWLQEETRQVATSSELQYFAADVDGLRSGLSRLEARLQRLTTKIKNGTQP